MKRGGRARAARCRGTAGAPWGVRARIERFVEPSVLLLLRERPAHGYELVAGLAELLPAERVDMPGLYRVLRALEADGLVSSEWQGDAPGPARRTYELTEDGRALLDAWAGALGRARERIEGFLTRYGRGR